MCERVFQENPYVLEDTRDQYKIWEKCEKSKDNFDAGLQPL